MDLLSALNGIGRVSLDIFVAITTYALGCRLPLQMDGQRFGWWWWFGGWYVGVAYLVYVATYLHYFVDGNCGPLVFRVFTYPATTIPTFPYPTLPTGFWFGYCYTTHRTHRSPPPLHTTVLLCTYLPHFLFVPTLHLPTTPHHCYHRLPPLTTTCTTTIHTYSHHTTFHHLSLHCTRFYHHLPHCYTPAPACLPPAHCTTATCLCLELLPGERTCT